MIWEGKNIENKFYKLCLKARQKKKIDKQQASKLYLQAIKEFIQKQDQIENYFRVKIQLAELYRSMKEFSQSIEIFNELLQKLKEKEDDLREKGMTKAIIDELRYEIYHNFGRLFITIATQASTKIYENDKQYNIYRQNMRKSYRYFLQAKKIIQAKILRNLNKQNKIEPSLSIQFLKLKSNSLQLLFQEAQQFKIQAQYQNLISEVQKAEKFYQCNKNKENQTHLYRCYFYKAISLRQIGKIKEALQLLIKVFRYQKSINSHQDAQKSRTQILRASLDLNLIQKALQYATNDQKTVIKLIKQRRISMQKFFNKNPIQLLKYTTQDYYNLFQQFDIGENQYIQDYQIINKNLIRLINVYKNDNQIKGLMFYYLAQSHNRLFKYQEASKYIVECLKIATKDQNERRDRRIQQFQITCNMMRDHEKIQNSYKKLLEQNSKLIKHVNDEQNKIPLDHQKANIQKPYNNYKANKKKYKQNNLIYDFYTPQQDKILKELHHQSSKKLQKMYKDKNEDQYEQLLQRSQINNVKTNQIAQFPHLKTSKQASLLEYQKKCSQNILIERQQIKKLLNNENVGQNPLIEMINLLPKEIQFILRWVPLENIDLRRHCINRNILEMIKNCNYLIDVKGFGVNQFNQIDLLTVYQILISVPYLGFLAFQNFKNQEDLNFNRIHSFMSKQQLINIQKPKNLPKLFTLLGSSSSSFNFLSIKKLKLKYCNLTDQNIIQIQIKNFINLQQISLSHNHLKGYSLSQIMKLRDLSVINLSDNPLEVFDFDNWRKRLLEQNYVIRKLKIQEIDWGRQELRQQLTYFIQMIQQIDFSRSLNISLLMDLISDKLIDEKICLNNLKKLTIKDSNLIDIKIYNFINLLSKCSNLCLLDLRFCIYTLDLKQILSNQPQLNRMIIKMSKTHDIKISLSSFSLINPQKDMKCTI